MKKLALALSLVCSRASGVEVPVAPHAVTVDGDLREWGAAAWIPVAPTGDLVGLRGVFTSPDDHTADVYAMWDAEWLYLAAAVVDDSFDAGRVGPDDRKGTGPDGRPKDLMFYFDHFKVFVRGPGADVGNNVWVAPRQEGDDAYAWGGRQRSPPAEGIPARVSSAARGAVYTYEMALPWTWLELCPQPDDRLDARFLFADSDLPGLEMRKKMQAGNDKWIWWQGHLDLTGRPEGLRAPPPPQVRTRRRTSPPATEPRVDEGVTRTIARLKAAREQAEASSALKSAEGPPGVSAPGQRDTPTPAAPDSAPEAPAGGPDSTRSISSERYARSMRAVLNRDLLVRKPQMEIPAWVREVEVDGSVSEAQVDTYVVTLVHSVARLVRERTNGRTDLFFLDMAARAGTRRGVARAFLMDLIGRYRAELGVPDSGAHQQLATAAAAAGVSAEAAVDLVDEICRRSLSLYEDGKVGMTRGMVKQAAKRARMSAADAEGLLRALLVSADAGS